MNVATPRHLAGRQMQRIAPDAVESAQPDMADESPYAGAQPHLVDRAIARVIERDTDGCDGARAAALLSEAALARRLDDLADTREGCAHWRSSLSALMRTLDLDATLGWQARLANELHCPHCTTPRAQHDWLLRALLQRLRGG